MTAGPNPFFDEINLWFREAPGLICYSDRHRSGTAYVMRSDYSCLRGADHTGSTGFGNMAQGIYIIKVD
ncbi:MAG: hypothetical protein MZV63_35925 [Marinilabiliales bacterium]|nr:hypothetical protein [Marinilabiliales bacterium]